MAAERSRSEGYLRKGGGGKETFNTCKPAKYARASVDFQAADRQDKLAFSSFEWSYERETADPRIAPSLGALSFFVSGVTKKKEK